MAHIETSKGLLGEMTGRWCGLPIVGGDIARNAQKNLKNKGVLSQEDSNLTEGVFATWEKYD